MMQRSSFSEVVKYICCQVLASLRSHAHAKTLVSHESLVIKKNKKKEESKRRSSVNLHSMPAPISTSGRKVCSFVAQLNTTLNISLFSHYER